LPNPSSRTNYGTLGFIICETTPITPKEVLKYFTLFYSDKNLDADEANLKFRKVRDI
jgi:hypothetical protein